METNSRLISLIKAETYTASADTQIYAANISHRLCSGRTLCAQSEFSPTIAMTYTVGTVTSLGQNVYDVQIKYSGTLSYLPKSRFYGDCSCPAAETVFGMFSVPVYSNNGVPTVTVDTSDATPIVTPIVECGYDLTNEVLISSVLTVNS